VRTREGEPYDWAWTQNNLGNTYWSRIRGERSDNLEKAIAAFEAALTVFTREAQPIEWAQAQANLAIVYRDRIRGERAKNLETAITGFKAALTVVTRETQPLIWASTQNNLGATYRDRVEGARPDNLESAISAFEAALMVFTREALPFQWAQAQHNLGSIYLGRVRGDRADNQEKAIAAFEAALTVLTPAALPYEWATTQNNLGIAYGNRIRGDRGQNLRKAVAAYAAALTVHTRDSLPRMHLLTARALGSTLLEAGEWRRAGAAYASARDAFLLLFGQGLNEAESRDLISQAGTLFAEAAYAAAQIGDGATALQLASEGRARLMAVALRLQALDLSDERRSRLDDLRAQVRVADHAVEATSTQGAARAAALEKLAGLRRQLLALVKDADTSVGDAETAREQARGVVGKGGAVVVPIITKVGGKVLIVTNGVRPAGGQNVTRPQQGGKAGAGRGARRADAEAPKPSITTLDLPDLTPTKLDILMRETAGQRAGSAPTPSTIFPRPRTRGWSRNGSPPSAILGRNCGRC
jgi:tetratricopeptide (TPR) repeat protein